MKKLLLIIPLIFAVGCYLPSKETTSKDNGWDVELCFEHEGYKIYRFHDGTRYRYYVTPEGSVADEYPTGKHSHEEETTVTIGP